MITRLQKKFLETCAKKPDGTPVKDLKYYIYMKRIQKHINEALELGEWLADNHPEILLDEEREITDASGRIKSNRRMKKMIQIIMKAKPAIQVELTMRDVLQKLDSKAED